MVPSVEQQLGFGLRSLNLEKGTVFSCLLCFDLPPLPFLFPSSSVLGTGGGKGSKEKFFYDFIGVELTDNVACVSDAQQSGSVICINISIFFPYRLLQIIE